MSSGKEKFKGWDDDYLRFLMDSRKKQLKTLLNYNDEQLRYKVMELTDRVKEIEIELKRRDDEDDHIYDEGYGG